MKAYMRSPHKTHSPAYLAPFPVYILHPVIRLLLISPSNLLDLIIFNNFHIETNKKTVIRTWVAYRGDEFGREP